MQNVIQVNVDKWLQGNYDQSVKDEILKLQKENPDELADAFYRNLEFGTGGLRGIMGMGTNRMNKYTVGMATQGYANYLNHSFGLGNVKVVVGHDSRNNSRTFAEIVANVMGANGIKVFLFEALRPTPELSFAIRHLGCQGGPNHAGGSMSAQVAPVGDDAASSFPLGDGNPAEPPAPRPCHTQSRGFPPPAPPLAQSRSPPPPQTQTPSPRRDMRPPRAGAVGPGTPHSAGIFV
jgi:hypothetical protein